jgi:hypothetical protein
MAQKVMIQTTDDLDGSEGASTVRFGLDGVSFEIDLSEDNAARLREVIQPFADVARRTGGRRERGTGPAVRANGGIVKAANGVPAAVFSSTEQTPATRSRAREIREWAAGAGYELSPRGRIPREVVEGFDNREPDEPAEDEKPRRGGRRKRA